MLREACYCDSMILSKNVEEKSNMETSTMKVSEFLWEYFRVQNNWSIYCPTYVVLFVLDSEYGSY